MQDKLFVSEPTTKHTRNPIIVESVPVFGTTRIANAHKLVAN